MLVIGHEGLGLLLVMAHVGYCRVLGHVGFGLLNVYVGICNNSSSFYNVMRGIQPYGQAEQFYQGETSSIAQHSLHQTVLRAAKTVSIFRVSGNMILAQQQQEREMAAKSCI